MFAKNTALILGYSIACLGCSGEEANSNDGMTSVTATDSASSNAPAPNPSAPGPSTVSPSMPSAVGPGPVAAGGVSGVGGAGPVGAGGDPVSVPVGNGGMPGPVGNAGAGPAPTETSGQGNAGENQGVAGAGVGGSGVAGANAGGAGVGGAGVGGAGVGGAGVAGAGNGGSGGAGDVIDTGAADTFSFFITSYFHIQELSGSPDGFGGDLRYNGAATGLDGADAICQEMARRVGFGHRTWRAFLSTSTVNAIDRVGDGPWYDFAGNLVANNVDGLTSGDRAAGGANESGTYDELGTFHDGRTDVNNDGIDDDDHDTMTATNADGTYAGFSCDDWTSTTAEPEEEEGGGQGGPFGGFGSGIMMGHSWPAQSGQSWVESHAGHACAAGTNFIQDGPGDSATVGGGGGYGGFYCFALPE